MMMFGVSSDDGGGDDCGDEDDLDRGGDFDCSSFRDFCGDGGQCHVDRKGSKSQLIINLLFHKSLRYPISLNYNKQTIHSLYDFLICSL